MVGKSNSVRVRHATDQCPKNFAEAHASLSAFGEIARLDVTLVSSTGFVLVTYFDVRDSDRVLFTLGSFAEVFPEAAHDFRAVVIPATEVAVLSSTFAGFQSFGDVLDVSLAGGDMIVEYFDMRAAHAALMSFPSGKPMQRQTCAEVSVHAPAQAPKCVLLPEATRVPPSISTFGAGASAPPGLELPASPAATVRSVKPVRAKVGHEDLSKFEIQADKILSGEDSRTTVMLRNVSRACSREDLSHLLKSIGLNDRYTFFYMPFDKRRGAHCGLGFLNFISPSDVLQLHTSMRTRLWHDFASVNGKAAPALSYGRIQGQDELEKHFSTLAVMYDVDAQKRPHFLQGESLYCDQTAKTCYIVPATACESEDMEMLDSNVAGG